MVRAVQVDVDTAGGIGEPAGFAEPPDEFLQGRDVGIVGEDRDLRVMR